jgi:signal transduction histidine kinase
MASVRGRGRGNSVIAFLTTIGLIAMTAVAVWFWLAYGRSEQARLALQQQLDDSNRKVESGALRDLARLQALGRMLGGVAHDLNNALTVLIMNLDIMSQDKVLGEKHGRRLANMTSAASRGSSLVRHLLSFSDKRRPDPEILCPTEAVVPMIELMQAALGKEPMVKAQPSDGEPWPTFLDAAGLEVAVMHLALALGETLPHGGELVVEVANLAKGPPGTSGEQVALILRTVPTDEGAAAPPVAWDSARIHDFVPDFLRSAQGRLTVAAEPGNVTRVTVYFPRCLEDPSA